MIMELVLPVSRCRVGGAETLNPGFAILGTAAAGAEAADARASALTRRSLRVLFRDTFVCCSIFVF